MNIQHLFNLNFVICCSSRVRFQYKQMGPIMHHICFFAVSSSLLVFWFGRACNTAFPSHRVLFSFKKNTTRNPLILLASKEKSKEKGKLCSLLSLVLLKRKLELQLLTSFYIVYVCTSQSKSLPAWKLRYEHWAWQFSRM